VRLTLEDLVSTLSGVCELSVDQTVHCLGLAVLNHVEQQQQLEEAALNHVKQQQQKKPEEAREAYALKIRQAEAKAEKAKAEKARLATRWAREKAATTAAKTAAEMASETAAKMALETAAKMALETAAKMALEAAEERLWTGSPDSVAGRLLHESTGLVRGSP
jgi:membrane protein involved in colicin uptake